MLLVSGRHRSLQVVRRPVRSLQSFQVRPAGPRFVLVWQPTRAPGGPKFSRVIRGQPLCPKEFFHANTSAILLTQGLCKLHSIKAVQDEIESLQLVYQKQGHVYKGIETHALSCMKYQHQGTRYVICADPKDVLRFFSLDPDKTSLLQCLDCLADLTKDTFPSRHTSAHTFIYVYIYIYMSTYMYYISIRWVVLNPQYHISPDKTGDK